jgi:hypothetical protein
MRHISKITLPSLFLVYRQITLIQEIFSAVFVTLALPAKRNQGADSDLSLREALLR